MDNILFYNSEKINMILNILNQVSWKGLEQVQAVAQISVILGNPENNNENIDDKESVDKMDGDE